MMSAVLSNPSHPEYGVATIPFPIPRDQYTYCMDLLEALEIGDAVKADCKVEKIDSFYTVLKRAEMLTVNVEELNYLAKRLESFDTGEAAQFQAMAHKLELFELKDLINLTFCCQQATVITDFSDLAAIGRDHYMNLHGGSASVDELNKLDGKGTARQLIESGSGTVTPYGVVYDNGMKLAPCLPVLRIKADKGQKVNRCFKDKELVAVSLIAERIGLVRPGNILSEWVCRSSHMGVSRRTASVSADKHNIVPLCVLVNIPGKKKSLNKRFVETSAFCEILDCSVGCPVVQGQVKRCGRCCAGFALSLGAFAG